MQLIDHYQAISTTSSKMLAAAKDSAWDDLRELEAKVAAQIAELKATASQAPLPPEHDKERMRLLKKMLADDAEIRDLMNPWMKQYAWYMSPAASHGKGAP
jgi:flagellar protein FliT